jgi:hypothetical protein
MPSWMFGKPGRFELSVNLIHGYLGTDYLRIYIPSKTIGTLLHLTLLSFYRLSTHLLYLLTNMVAMEPI